MSDAEEWNVPSWWPPRDKPWVADIEEMRDEVADNEDRDMDLQAQAFFSEPWSGLL